MFVRVAAYVMLHVLVPRPLLTKAILGDRERSLVVLVDLNTFVNRGCYECSYLS